MSNPSENLRRRKDLSPFLFHFTKGENADEVIRTIVNESKLKSDAGYICFTERPLIMCDELMSYFKRFSKPMYKPYGIGIRRDTLYKMGARPVIYSTPEEGELLPEAFRWRFLQMDVDSYDYSWLREWRYPSSELDFSKFNTDDVIIVTPTKMEEELAFTPDYDVDFAYDSDDKIARPYLIQTGATRAWRSINFDRVRKEQLTDYMVDAQTYFEQRIGEDYEDSVLK